ncbi:MAG TPA: hypothetical protein VFX44_00810 [Solirubrobacterales bacterium]|nr:hypothetical protein [Solirubrobacterales bacterium]
MRSIATIGVAAALVVAGVAAAQGGSEGGGSNPGKRPPGPPPMGIGMKGLTYAQLHVLDKEGESETIRIDQGKVKSVGESSITVTENDESEVTIPVGESTKVLGKPGQETTLEDLQAGQQVSVCAPEGEAAKTIMVLPKKGEAPGGKGAPMPPPGA